MRLALVYGGQYPSVVDAKGGTLAVFIGIGRGYFAGLDGRCYCNSVL